MKTSDHSTRRDRARATDEIESCLWRGCLTGAMLPDTLMLFSCIRRLAVFLDWKFLRTFPKTPTTTD